MDDINLGAAIARERRAAQVTQGELAAHLGVTKAAVSKWELEQSMPDVALLPRIAAYFDLTLDELFDYRPQLVGDDLQDAYLRLLAQFDEDPEAAFANAEDLVRSHYSCWPALQQMGMLYAQRATLDPDRAEPLAARAAELFERVERHADDVELVRAARMMRASVMSVQGDLDGCIALFESLKPDRTAANIDLMLASMYQQRGDLDAGLKLFQESMGWCVMNAISCVSAQIPLYADDAEHLEALLRAGEGVLSGFDLQNQSPMTVLTFCTNASSACLQAGDEDRAANYLERFTSLLEELDARNRLVRDRLPFGVLELLAFDTLPAFAATTLLACGAVAAMIPIGTSLPLALALAVLVGAASLLCCGLDAVRLFPGGPRLCYEYGALALVGVGFALSLFASAAVAAMGMALFAAAVALVVRFGSECMR